MSCCKPVVINETPTYQEMVFLSTQVTEGALDYPGRLTNVDILLFRAEDPFMEMNYMVTGRETRNRVIHTHISTHRVVDGASRLFVSTISFDLDAKTYQVVHHTKVDFHAIGVVITMETTPVTSVGFEKLRPGVYKVNTPAGYNAARIDHAERFLADIETPPWAELPGMLVITESANTWIPKTNLSPLVWK